MSAVCMNSFQYMVPLHNVGAGGGIYGYMQKRSVPSILAGLGFGTLYGVSARFIQTGRALDGVDLSICKSTPCTTLLMTSGFHFDVSGYGAASLFHSSQYASGPEFSSGNYPGSHGLCLLRITPSTLCIGSKYTRSTSCSMNVVNDNKERGYYWQQYFQSFITMCMLSDSLGNTLYIRLNWPWRD